LHVPGYNNTDPVVGKQKEVTMWNGQQEEILSHIEWREGHLIVEADAGTGKTSVITEAHKRMHPEIRDSSVSLSFNRHINEELKLHMPEGVRVNTIHSIGMSALIRHFHPSTNRYVDKYKYEHLVDEQFDALSIKAKPAEMWRWKETCIDLIGKSQLTLADTDPMNLLITMMHFGMDSTMDIVLMSKVVTKCIQRGSNQCSYVVDFNDMVHQVAIGRVKVDKYLSVAVDEMQDMNAAQQAVVFFLLDAEGQVIGVGDRNQAIYGFAGADTLGMDTFRIKLNAHTLPLTICYRCPKSHLRYARTIVPSIQDAPDAIEGVVEIVRDPMEIYRREGWLPGDLWICRTTAPLVEQCLILVQSDIPCNVIGKDMAKNINRAISETADIKGFHFSEFMRYLQEWLNRKIELFREQKRSELAISAIQDTAQCIAHLYRGGVDFYNVRSIKGLKNYAETIFKKDPQIGQVSLCTIHRSKGLQSDSRVIVLRPDQLPHNKANLEWEQEQEMHLEYIAYTRSRYALYFVGQLPKGRQE
jgi:superfamily I DNA/RNA helicase